MMTPIIVMVIAGLIASWFAGYRHGLIDKIDEIKLAVGMDAITEISDRLRGMGRGMDIMCPKCGCATGVKLGDISRVSEDADARHQTENQKGGMRG